MDIVKRKLSVLPAILLIATVLTSCGADTRSPQSPPAEEEHEAHQEHEKHQSVLELTDEQINAVGIKIGKIEKRNLTEVVKSSGQLAVPPQNAAQINVLSGGIIRKINVIEGQRVSKGQVLVTVENQELIRLQQEYLEATGGFTYVEAEYNRQQLLKAANAGTGKAHQLAEANYNAGRSKIRALTRQLQQYGISASKVAGGTLEMQVPVLAPINGTIGKITAQTGSYAQPGVALMDIVDNSKIHADLIVFEKDLSKIKVGQKVDFQLTNQKNEDIAGEIYGINKSFENDSKGVVVHAVIKRPGANLIPGMYVTGLIGVGNVLSDAVPIDAVVRSEGTSYIFIVDKAGGPDKKNHFEKVEVTTGVSELGYIQITPLSKLPASVQIVTKGAFYLQSKSSGPSEHSH
jgi:cobalt-zinc-cadmium efflux system membrane fusion protein